jgi:hypothetical protein
VPPECSGVVVKMSKLEESGAGIAQRQKASVTDISVMYNALVMICSRTVGNDVGNGT